jgi:hypothetical protein
MEMTLDQRNDYSNSQYLEKRKHGSEQFQPLLESDMDDGVMDCVPRFPVGRSNDHRLDPYHRSTFSNGCFHVPHNSTLQQHLPKSPQKRKCATARNLFAHSNHSDTKRKKEEEFPVQFRYRDDYLKLYQKPVPCRSYERIGHPSLKIIRFRLPEHLISLLDTIIDGCEEYAASLPCGWMTEIFSLTKQDIALREIPHLYQMAKVRIMHSLHVCVWLF